MARQYCKKCETQIFFHEELLEDTCFKCMDKEYSEKQEKVNITKEFKEIDKKEYTGELL